MKDAQESGALGFIRRAPREKNVIVPHLLGGSELLSQCYVCALWPGWSSREPITDWTGGLWVVKASYSESCKKTQLD